MRDKAGDIVSAGLLLALAVAMLALTFNFPPPGQPNDPGTAAFPRIVGGALTIFAVLQLLRAEKGEPLPRGWAALRVFGILVLLAIYATVLEMLGFILATVLFLFCAILLAGARRPLYLILVPPTLSVALFYLFFRLLEVSLPRGLVEGVLF